MSYLLRLVGADDTVYDFPKTFYPADRSIQNTVPVAKLARTHGARLLTGYLGSVRLVIRGGLLGPNAPIGGQSNWRTAIDDLRHALMNTPATLYFGENDRYYRCVQMEQEGEPYDATHFARINAGMEIPLVTGDPYRYSTNLKTDTWSAPSTGDTHPVTTAGQETSLPEIRITVAGTGLQIIAFTLTSNTTSEELTLAGTVNGGDTIAIDSLLKTVKIGTTDTRTLFDGQFITLRAGSNTIQVTMTSGSITQIVFYWRDRWL